jgi:hypothetical protein
LAVAAVLRKWFYFMGLCCFLRSATGGRFVLCPAVLQRQSFESISETSRAAGGSRRPGVNFDTSDVGGRLGSATRAVRHCGRPPRRRGLRQGSTLPTHHATPRLKTAVDSEVFWNESTKLRFFFPNLYSPRSLVCYRRRATRPSARPHLVAASFHRPTTAGCRSPWRGVPSRVLFSQGDLPHGAIRLFPRVPVRTVQPV